MNSLTSIGPPARGYSICMPCRNLVLLAIQGSFQHFLECRLPVWAAVQKLSQSQKYVDYSLFSSGKLLVLNYVNKCVCVAVIYIHF